MFGDILAQDYNRYGCMATNGTWFANLCEYLSKYGVTIELDEQYHFKRVRVGDGSLMALFFQFPFDHRQAERFNRVRHFKGVVRVSDIISCDGRTMEPSMLDNTSGDYSSYTFPYQKPTRGDFAFWKDCIRSMTSASFTLPVALGTFISEGQLPRRRVTTADQNELYFC